MEKKDLLITAVLVGSASVGFTSCRENKKIVLTPTVQPVPATSVKVNNAESTPESALYEPYQGELLDLTLNIIHSSSLGSLQELGKFLDSQNTKLGMKSKTIRFIKENPTNLIQVSQSEPQVFFNTETISNVFDQDSNVIITSSEPVAVTYLAVNEDNLRKKYTDVEIALIFLEKIRLANTLNTVYDLEHQSSLIKKPSDVVNEFNTVHQSLEVQFWYDIGVNVVPELENKGMKTTKRLDSLKSAQNMTFEQWMKQYPKIDLPGLNTAN